MTKKDAITRIEDILRKLTSIPESNLAEVSSKIYADVVATAVDDERESWIDIAARPSGSIN